MEEILCVEINTPIDEIKTKKYTFSPVSDIYVEESCFLLQSYEHGTTLKHMCEPRQIYQRRI